MENNAICSGLTCLNCEGTIKFTFEDLLLKRDIICSMCYMQMDMIVPPNVEVILQEIKLAQLNDSHAKSFRGMSF